MKIRWNHRYVQLGVTAFLVIAASILFYYGIFHMKSLITGIKTFFGIMAPIIYGAAIAYLLTPIVNFLERKIIFPIFEKRNKKAEIGRKRRTSAPQIPEILSRFSPAHRRSPSTSEFTGKSIPYFAGRDKILPVRNRPFPEKRQLGKLSVSFCFRGIQRRKVVVY